VREFLVFLDMKHEVATVEVFHHKEQVRLCKQQISHVIVPRLMKLLNQSINQSINQSVNEVLLACG